MRILRPELSVPALSALILAACASDPGPPKRDPHNDATLFISPAGKPFRAAPHQAYPVRDWFAEANTSHDGKLTKAQFRADFQAFFKTLDVDNNGVLDGQEIVAYEEAVAPEILPRLAQMQATEVRVQDPGETQGPRRQRVGAAPRRLAQAPERRGQATFDGAPEFSLQNVSEPILSADVNFDGKVSLEEYLAAADRRFDGLDKTKLGYLTLDTLPQTPEQIVVEGKRKK